MTNVTPPVRSAYELRKILEYMKLLQHHFLAQDELIAIYPDLIPDLFMYRSTPNCSCKQRIQTKVTAEYENLQTLIDGTLKLHGVVVSDTVSDTVPDITPIPKVTIPPAPINPRKFTEAEAERMLKPFLPKDMWANYEDIIGEIIEIDANPDKYKELITTAKKSWFYNGLNIIETTVKDENNNEKVIWRIFFY